jgi:hypothetical protein
MDIEIRRNRDIQFNVTCENPEKLKELFQLTDEQKRQQKRFETWRRQVEDEFWRFVKEHPTKDCNGELIKPETHEIGFDFSLPDDDGIMIAKVMWVRPKKSEYEK